MQALADRFLAGLYLFERIVTAAGFAVMALSLIADVLSRELLGTGIFGAPQVGVFGMIVVTMLGLGIASQTGSHLRARLFDRLVPRAWDRVIDRLSEFVFAGFCLGMAAIALAVVEESFALGETSPVLRWQIWPFQAVIVLAFGIAALRHSLFGLFPDLRPAPAGESDAPASPDGPPPAVRSPDVGTA